jgi:4-hydroxybutyrate CoA-transferase
MDYSEIYRSKLMTADQAAAQVDSGWVLGMDAAPTQADGIIAAVTEHVKNSSVHDVKVHMMLDGYPYEFFADLRRAERQNQRRVLVLLRRSAPGRERRLCRPHSRLLPRHSRPHPRKCYDYDAFCVAVSPMDSHGYFSMATTGVVYRGHDRQVEAHIHRGQQVPAQMPLRHTATCFPGAGIVENDHPMPVLKPTVLDDTSRTIGNLIAEQIPDGACIQLGIGAIPDATGDALKTKHDLGIHTEMFTDSMVGLSSAAR